MRSGGDVALAVDGRLPANVVGWDEVEVGLGDLDVVAEVIGETNLQALDAGAGLFGGFEGGEPGFVVAGEGVDAVELGIVAGADGAAIGEAGGEGVGEAAFEKVAEFGELCDAV